MKNSLVLLLLPLLFFSCKKTNEQLLADASKLIKQEKYKEAKKICSIVIKQNGKLQRAFYYRGICNSAIKKYKEAYSDFSRVIDMQTYGNISITFNQEMPHAGEEVKMQVPYNDAFFQRALVKYNMDSGKSTFLDLKWLIDNNYNEKSGCYLHQGFICIRIKDTSYACRCFALASKYASVQEDEEEANRMIEKYCKH